MRIANAPCSWGVLEFAANCRTAPYNDVLDEMRAAGYAGTELGDWGFMPTDPDDLRRELAKRDLQLVGAFVPVALARPDAHDLGLQTALRTARLLRGAGATDAFIVLSDDNATVPERESNAGRIAPEHMLTRSQWATFAAGASRIAEAVREDTELRTVFHPHCGGYVETTGEIDELMAHTDAAVLGLVLDTGHIMYGGGNPLEVLRAHADRVWHVHFKDCDPRVLHQTRQEGRGYLSTVRQQVFCELGAGGVDFVQVTAALRRLDYNGWIVVEQDVFPGQGSPMQTAVRSREYLATLGI